MSIEVQSYDPKKVNVIVAGRAITGFASDGVVTLSKNEDSVTPSVGAKGDVAYSENANESGTIALTLMSTSSSLPYLRELEAKRRLITVSVQDANDADSFAMSAVSYTHLGETCGGSPPQIAVLLCPEEGA